MNSYDPMTVYSYIDIQGRYNYGNQPKIMFWNLSKFAESIAYLIDENEMVAKKKILDSLIKDKPLKPGSFRGRKNTAPEKKPSVNGENHA